MAVPMQYLLILYGLTRRSSNTSFNKDLARPSCFSSMTTNGSIEAVVFETKLLNIKLQSMVSRSVFSSFTNVMRSKAVSKLAFRVSEGYGSWKSAADGMMQRIGIAVRSI